MLKKLIPIVCLFPLILNAAEHDESAPAKWKGEGEFGFTSTSGNTDSENVKASLKISRELEQWKHKASIEAFRAEADDVTSADSLVLRGRSEYTIEENRYLFGQLRYEDDEFSGYDYQASLTLGVGSRLIQNERQLLDLSIGLGFRSIKDTATGDTEDEGIVTAELAYEHKISESATFIQTILIESGDENTHSEAETAMKTKIDGNLSAKISYLLKRNSEVPTDVDKTDEIVTVSLVYGF